MRRERTLVSGTTCRRSTPCRSATTSMVSPGLFRRIGLLRSLDPSRDRPSTERILSPDRSPASRARSKTSMTVGHGEPSQNGGAEYLEREVSPEIDQKTRLIRRCEREQERERDVLGRSARGFGQVSIPEQRGQCAQSTRLGEFCPTGCRPPCHPESKRVHLHRRRHTCRRCQA